MLRASLSLPQTRSLMPGTSIGAVKLISEHLGCRSGAEVNPRSTCSAWRRMIYERRNLPPVRARFHKRPASWAARSATIAPERHAQNAVTSAKTNPERRGDGDVSVGYLLPGCRRAGTMPRRPRRSAVRTNHEADGWKNC